MIAKYIAFLVMALFPTFLQGITYQITNVLRTNNILLAKINNNGIIAGSTVKDNQMVAFIYDYQNEETVFLRAFDSESTVALDINNKNELVGFFKQEDFSPKQGRIEHSVPFIYSEDKGFLSLASTLGYAFGDYESIRINDLGWIAGYGFIDSMFDDYSRKGDFNRYYSSLIYNGKNAAVLNCPSLQVGIKSINNKGDAAGGVFYSSRHMGNGQPAYAFIWDSVQKKILPLGNLGGEDKFYSCATDINNSKQVVGFSEVNIKKSRYYCRHAFIWDKAAMFDLGTLEQDQDSVALAINNQGDVVGSSGKRAFIWTRLTGMVDLTSIN